MAPLDTSHPFTTAQARAAGISASRLRSKEFRRLSKGRFVSAERSPSALLDAEAALLGHSPEAFASHTTAARALRLPVPLDAEEHVSVFDPVDRRRRRGLRCHVASPETRVLVFHGVRISDPAYVFLQLAAILTLVDLVVVGDVIARREWYSPEQLVAICERSEDPHARRALAAARLVRARVDSPMETRLRLLLVLAGFPEPEVDFRVRAENGDVLRRFDLYYRDVRVIVEYDGRQHAEDPEQYDKDIERREELDDGEWRIVIVTAKGIYVDPERTLLRVRKVLKSRGMTGLPSGFRPEWRKHFPGRANDLRSKP